jgi:hypothetical protein
VKELAGSVAHDCPRRKSPKRPKGKPGATGEARGIEDGAVMRQLAEDDVVTDADEEELEAC